MKNASKQFGLTAFVALVAFCLATLSFTSCDELFDYSRAYDYGKSGGGGYNPPQQSSPSTPTGVSASALSSSSIRISWNAPSYGSTPIYYRIYRLSSSSGTYTLLTSVYDTTYTDTGLSASTTYYYKVSAFNSYGESSQSSAVSATTSSSTSNNAPNTPTGVSASALSSSSIHISWNASSSGDTPTYYFIYRSTSSSGTYTYIGYISGTTYSYTNYNLSASTTYYYKVSAVNSYGESSLSSADWATTDYY